MLSPIPSPFRRIFLFEGSISGKPARHARGPTDLNASAPLRYERMFDTRLNLCYNDFMKEKGGCAVRHDELIAFLLRAKRATYAGKGPEAPPSRPDSHDLRYQEGNLLYIDSYLGGERFAGEEALWRDGQPLWSMNYAGRVTGQPFSGDFLKEALRAVPPDMPYRGPSAYEKDGYAYECHASGDFDWFEGAERITYQGRQVYECRFHGGAVR